MFLCSNKWISLELAKTNLIYVLTFAIFYFKLAILQYNYVSLNIHVVENIPEESYELLWRVCCFECITFQSFQGILRNMITLIENKENKFNCRVCWLLHSVRKIVLHFRIPATTLTEGGGSGASETWNIFIFQMCHTQKTTKN